jgi:hypothetical protein
MYAESETLLVAAFPALAYIFKWRAAFEVDNRVAEKYLCIQVFICSKTGSANKKNAASRATKWPTHCLHFKLIF